MTDVVISPITSGYNTSKLNTNFVALADKINSEVLHTSGGGNTMDQDLDMNSFSLLNLRTDPNNPDSMLTVGDAKDQFYQIGLIPNTTNDSDAISYGQASQIIEAASVGTDPDNVALYSVLASPEAGKGASLVYDAAKSSDLASTAPGKGTSLIGWVSSFMGAVARTLYSKLKDVDPTPQDFGAVGDGITDDTIALQAAIDNTSKVLNLGDGYTYKVSRLIGRSDLHLKGSSNLDFSGNSTYTSSFTDPLFKFFGTAGTAVAVTSDIAPGDKVITVASTAGIVAGDIIEIATPGSDGGFYDTSLAVRNGESVMVYSVDSGTQITLSESVVDETGYTVANNAQIRKLLMLENITIDRGIKMIGKGRPTSGSGDLGLVFWYCRNVKVHCSFTGVDYTAVRFESCYNYEASGCTVYHDPKGINGTVNYGIVPASSSNHGRVFNNIGFNMRHFMVTSHLSSALGIDAHGVVRNLDVYDNTAVNTWHAGFATHNDADRVTIRNNTCIGCAFAINVRERNVEVVGNKGIRCQQIIYLSGQPRNIIIRGNTGRDYTGALVFSDFSSGVRDIQDISIDNNEGERGQAGLYMSFPAPIVAHSRISVTRNKLRNCTGAGGAQSMIRVSGSSVESLTIKDNEITDCTSTSGISVEAGGDKVLILNNVITGISGNGVNTAGTFTLSYGKNNIAKNWSGSSAMTNSSTITSDNLINASL